MDSEKIFWALAALVMVGVFAFLISGSFVGPVNAAQQNLQLGAQAGNAQALGGGSALAAVNDGVQEVALSVQGGTYYPNPVRVKKGVPVRLVADMNSMRGCSRSIVIPDFGVSKTVGAGDNAIEFTPDKSGTFSFSCSMGMYRGTIVVEEADGSVAAFTGSAPKAAAGSCGAGGGGCGCGG
jgi:plastocyanin